MTVYPSYFIRFSVANPDSLEKPSSNYDYCCDEASYKKALEKLKSLHSETPCLNAEISYDEETYTYHPDDYYTRSQDGRSFSHPEVPAKKMMELHSCCERKEHKGDMSAVERCFNRVFPGSLSSFNLNVPKEMRDPLVNEYLKKYYPPKSEQNSV